MKIKADFITNSSSSSYIICLPDEWKLPTIDEIKENTELLNYYAVEDPEVEDEVRNILSCLKDLKENPDVLFSENEFGSAFHEIMWMIDEDYFIMSMYAEEDSGYIMSISKEKIAKWYMNIFTRKLEL